MTKEESALLLQQMAAGGEAAKEAVAEIYRQHYKLLYSTALNLLQDEVDAEEVVHLLFVDLLRGHKISHIENIQVFCYVTIKNRCLNILRARTRAGKSRGKTYNYQQMPGYEEPFVNPDEDPYAEREKRALDAVDRLSPRYQKALHLSYWEKRTHREIAEIMSITLMTSQTLVKKALITLRKMTNDAALD